MRVVVIGDIVGSRDVPDRRALQRQLVSAVARLNARLAQGGVLLSPYTITLGDEVQAVYADPATVILDVITLQGELLPHRMRFCVGVGEISTRINPTAAIGMDGPAFHCARAGIEQLKSAGDGALAVAAEAGVDVDLEDAAARLLDAQVRGWRPNRFKVFLADRPGVDDPSARPDARKVARRIGITAAAVYKNRAEGQMDLFSRAARSIGRSLEKKIAPAPRAARSHS